MWLQDSLSLYSTVRSLLVAWIPFWILPHFGWGVRTSPRFKANKGYGSIVLSSPAHPCPSIPPLTLFCPSWQQPFSLISSPLYTSFAQFTIHIFLHICLSPVRDIEEHPYLLLKLLNTYIFEGKVSLCLPRLTSPSFCLKLPKVCHHDQLSTHNTLKISFSWYFPDYFFLKI